jgi:hypothetical protein
MNPIPKNEEFTMVNADRIPVRALDSSYDFRKGTSLFGIQLKHIN